jgi:hypothetical protein
LIGDFLIPREVSSGIEVRKTAFLPLRSKIKFETIGLQTIEETLFANRKTK